MGGLSMIGYGAKIPPWVIKVLRLLGCLMVLAIAVLSLIPGNIRPHIAGSHYSSHYVEHFAAYLIAAVLLGLCLRSRKQLIKIAILMTFYAGILEIAQLWIPGRNSTIADFAASSLGIWCGSLAMFFTSKWASSTTAA